MSSPNDPGHTAAGDPANGNRPKPGPSRATPTGPISTTGPLADPGDVPPWQRGPAARARQGKRRPPDAAHTGGIDSREARVNRFVSGPAAPSKPVDSDGPAPSPRAEAYQSELPDLSGPLPRPPAPRKTMTDRPGGEPPPGPAGRMSAPTSRIQVGARPRGPVRAAMQIRRVDPWSVLKVSLVLSVALFFVWMVAVAFLYLVLGGMGVWSKLNSNVGDLLTAQGGSAAELVSSGTIFGGAALIGLVNIVLLTAMATVGAFIYNLTTDLVGGIEVTLADRD
ncbi:DUF3566 domain-containing protein [Mycobacterium sp.]|uniref:DUF3566 domain-containing protein n=1 Tax=Mycobacterium sp. TaxID=1785 RepID=UPI002D670723|nr:DUF3566 domain-containing protein [Mycobacterium sp.]HZA11802.1 DUF3566 domain-containing protein [Mycobacterium sp.]